jgi:hypothetical protein
VTGQWFSPDTPVSSINKTDRHDIAEIFLKVALSTISQPKLNLISPPSPTITIKITSFDHPELHHTNRRDNI